MEHSSLSDLITALEYGHNFHISVVLFDRCGNNWANVPRDWDAPCRINFFNRRTGHAYTTGKIGYQTLEAAFIGNGGKVE